MRHKFLI